MSTTFPYAIYNIKQDIRRDRDDISSRIMLREFNVKSKPGSSPFENLLSIFSKLLVKKRRNVLVSRSLHCPDEVKSGFNNLKRKAFLGLGINQHLSKQVLNPDFNDGMLIDFGVYHFHLGTGTTKDKLGNHFAERSGPVLAAFVDDDNFYCLKISPHGNDLWFDEELVEIMHKEWPNAIARYRLNRDVIAPETYGEGDRVALRKTRVNTVLTMKDGTMYFSTGGGMTTAGTSINSSVIGTRHNRVMFDVAEILYKFLPSLDYFYLPNKLVGPVVLKLLNTEGDNFYLYDESLGNYYCLKYKEHQLNMYPLSIFNTKFKAIGCTEMNPVTMAIYNFYGYTFGYIMSESSN